MTTLNATGARKKMNNALDFINSEFNYISDNVPESNKQLKPSIVINHGLAKTKHIAITWKQLEMIKQLLIETNEKDN